MISIREVAKLAGTSPATVSRVLNGTAKVSQEKEERILRVIKETGYIPNEAARVLFKKTSKTIGLVIPSIRNPYFTELASHVDASAEKYGYRPILFCTNYDPEKEKAAIQSLISTSADAIIVASCTESIKETLANCPVLVVALDATFVDANVKACIYCDYYEGGRLAAEHLINCGCKNIVCIKGPQNRYSANARYQGYADVCKERDIPEQTIECDYDFIRGLAMTEELLNKYPGVDGIIACNDIVAISTYKVLRKRGIIVPDNIQLVGFDDISIATLLSPELTTISQPIETMVETAINLIADQEWDERSSVNIIYPVSLIQRQTTKQ